MEEGGMKYVAGYIARKFPHYELGTVATKGDGTWIGAVSARDGKLIQPTSEFLEMVKVMEKMFLCHHGNKTLKPGKGAIQLLTELINNCLNGEKVTLHIDVIKFYVRFRTFFRMRILNRDIMPERSKQNKMKKFLL